MQIDISAQQYRLLLDMVYIGNWVLNAAREQSDRITDYDDVESKIFSYCPQGGMKALAEVEDGVVYPSRAYEEGGIHEAIADYEDSVFFDILAEELSRRDMDAEGVRPDDIEELASRMDSYLEEFDRNGLDNVSVTGV